MEVNAQHGTVSSRARCTALRVVTGGVQQNLMPSIKGVTCSEEGCPVRQILGRQLCVAGEEAPSIVRCGEGQTKPHN